MDNIETIIGWSLALISIVLGLAQMRQNFNLKKQIRSNNWLFYQRTSNLGGTIQKSLKLAQEENLKRELFENIVRSDALCGELMKENIRLIQYSEPTFTSQDIDKWVEEGKIGGGYEGIFRKYLIG